MSEEFNNRYAFEAFTFHSTKLISLVLVRFSVYQHMSLKGTNHKGHEKPSAPGRKQVSEESSMEMCPYLRV